VDPSHRSFPGAHNCTAWSHFSVSCLCEVVVVVVVVAVDVVVVAES